jgi:hypothetical protein
MVGGCSWISFAISLAFDSPHQHFYNSFESQKDRAVAHALRGGIGILRGRLRILLVVNRPQETSRPALNRQPSC